tara:strand:- start:107 stop:751 length:645 start_codon:yes stop_codon:yes gene_type:complete
MEHSPDQQLIGPAIELIKKNANLVWRINVKPESVAMVDYAQLKEERTAYMTALATFMQSSAPLVQQDPKAAPALMEMLKWGLAGFKGSSEIEGVLDQAINAMQAEEQKGGQGQQQPPSDAQLKMQMEQGRQEYEMKKLEITQQFEREKWQYESQKIQTEGQISGQQTQMEAQGDLQKEQAQFQFNMDEERNETTEFIKRETARRRLNPPNSSGT